MTRIAQQQLESHLWCAAMKRLHESAEAAFAAEKRMVKLLVNERILIPNQE